MGDYRDELQSALAQIEALRTENAALRAKVHPPSTTSPQGDAAPQNPFSPSSAPASFTIQKILAVFVTSVAFITLSSLARRLWETPEPPLRMPNVPSVSSSRVTPNLPILPTTIRLPEATNVPTRTVDVVDERGSTIQPVRIYPSAGFASSVHWQDPTRGLYVLTTLPDAECSVGGVRFTTPRPVFLEPGVYTVRCEVGHARHLWSVRIAARQVTFDLEHRIGR